MDCIDGECLRETRLVEAGIVIRGQAEQFVFCVAAAGQDGVHVDVVPYFCPSEQGASPAPVRPSRFPQPT